MFTYNGVSLTTSFNGSAYTGTYTGNFSLGSADIYGGAGGSGLYPRTSSSTGYTLSLSSSANYFGLWFSALDSGNDLKFYNNNVLVYDFTPAAFISLVGSCPGSAFCGNPNNGGDSGEQFAYLNFYDASGTFNQVTFSESIASNGFESDNHAVATLDAPPGGTAIVTTPEPSSLALMAVGGILLLLLTVRARIVAC